jgi:hypothetical protein
VGADAQASAASQKSPLPDGVPLDAIMRLRAPLLLACGGAMKADEMHAGFPQVDDR